jgi:hypothetical protein
MKMVSPKSPPPTPPHPAPSIPPIPGPDDTEVIQRMRYLMLENFSFPDIATFFSFLFNKEALQMKDFNKF